MSILKNKFLHWLLLLCPMISVLLYDQGLRKERFYELNPSAIGKGGLHYVSQHIVEPSYFLNAGIVGLLLFAIFKFAYTNYSKGVLIPLTINVGKVILGGASIFLVMLIHSLFTGMITQ